MDYRDAGGSVNNLKITSTSGNSNGTGIRLINFATAEAATNLNVDGLKATCSSGGSNGYCISVQDSSATQDATMNVWNFDAVQSETSASLTVGANANGDNAKLNLYSGNLRGNDADASNTSNGVITLYATNLYNGTTSGTVLVGTGTFNAEKVKTSGSITINGTALNFLGASASSMTVGRQTTASTAGSSLTIEGGGATSGGTDLNGGDVIIKAGQPTGLGKSSVRLQAASAGTASGSSENVPVDRLVIPSSKTITEDVATDLFSIDVGSGTSCGGTINWETSITNGTDFQILSGMTTYSIANKSGTFSTAITNNTSNDAKVTTSGTLTTTWDINTSGTTATIRITHNSSLTPSAGHPRINYNVNNNCYKNITIL